MKYSSSPKNSSKQSQANPPLVPPATTLAAAVAAVLCGLSGHSAMAQSTPGLESQVQNLKTQVDELQKKVDEQKKASNSQNTGLAAGPLTINFGGFVELAGFYRNRNETADVGSNFNTGIPFPISAQDHLSEFRESARQSRLSIQVLGPQDAKSAAEAYYETDFLGAAPTANSNESNSYNLRMRHIYGLYTRKDMDFLMMAGQNWSLATMYKKGLTPKQEQVPQTIDAQYAVGFNWTRNPQIRLVKNFAKKVALGLSFESPQTLVAVGPNAPTVTTVYNNAGGSLFSSTNNYSLDYAPDVIAKLAVDPGWGHYEVYGLQRWFRDRAAGHNNTTSTAGVGGGVILPLIANVLEFQASGLVGDGIGRYGSAQLPDVTILSDGSLAKIHERHYLLGLTAKPTSTFTLYGYYGEERADSKYNSAVVGSSTLGYGYGSPLYNNSGCLIEGAATSTCVANSRSIKQASVGLWWKYYQGTLGNLQLGLQGSHTKRETFTGAGGSPDTSMNVAMISFRYYPYQK